MSARTKTPPDAGLKLEEQERRPVLRQDAALQSVATLFGLDIY